VTLLALALSAIAPPVAPPLIPPPPPAIVAPPRWSGEPDLCVITITTRDPDGARIVRHFYRILGEGGAAAERRPAFAAAQERRCAASPPLDLDDPAGDRGLIMLNDSEDAREGAVGISMIWQAQREARAGRFGDIACDADAAPDERAPECADPRRLLARLDLATVHMVDVVRRDGGPVYSVEAMFDLAAGPGWALKLEAEISGSVRFLRAQLSRLRLFDVVDVPPPVE